LGKEEIEGRRERILDMREDEDEIEIRGDCENGRKEEKESMGGIWKD